jgi:uncharacterized protein (TIGR02284 family)
MIGDDRTATLNSLLQGELSAIETYQQALQKVGDDPSAAELRRVEYEHREAATALRQRVHEDGGRPEATSGAWGAWAKLVEGVSKLFGDAAALKALKEGEEHGIKQYEAALKETKLDGDTRTLISAQLLPQTRSHLQVLDRCIESVK